MIHEALEREGRSVDRDDEMVTPTVTELRRHGQPLVPLVRHPQFATAAPRAA
jgi:hypothetical protein